MNSDPYDSAAWRTFGMLDADESAIFDEAMRHDPVLRGAYLEMDRLSAAIAASSATPIEPKAGQLERLQSRLNLGTSRGAYLWLGLSGWAVAAALTVILVLDHTGTLGKPQESAAVGQSPATQPKASPKVSTSPATSHAPTSPDIAEQAKPDSNPTTSEPASDIDAKTAIVRVETKRLVQEIEVLRESLEKFQHRDRVLFEAVPGKALPIVMIMNPPGLGEDEEPSLVSNDDQSPITTMLGDAVKLLTARAMTVHSAETGDLPPTVSTDDIPLAEDHPTAIPIYDPARGTGTMIVKGLPPAEPGKRYNLWVNAATGEKPIYVGSLPEGSTSGVDSFDFSLGSNLILPARFMLTKDLSDHAVAPSSSNTVLEGPPAPAP